MLFQMLTAFCRAVLALGMPPMWRLITLSLALAVLTFAALWLAVAGVLYDATFFEWRPLNWLVDLLGGLAVLALTWLLFPAIVSLIMSFFLERVAAAVEARHYPGRGPARRQPIGEVRALLGQGCGQIGDFAAVDNSHTRRFRARRARLPEHPGSGRMRLQVPVSGVHRLPDSVQIGFAIGGARSLVGRTLTPGRRRRQKEAGTYSHRNHRVSQYVFHR